MLALRSVVSVLVRFVGRSFSANSSGALRAAAARPPSVAEPGRRARPHRNACQLYGLTGQWTHFSRACPVGWSEQER
jgi:hypothetical protein